MTVRALTFKELMDKVGGSSNLEKWEPPRIVVVFDPGETVGWAVFDGCSLLKAGQEAADAKGRLRFVRYLIESWNPKAVVAEDYIVYAHKALSHSWSPLDTAKLVGAIEMACVIHDVPLYLQTASTGKAFCTDAKLRNWGMYQPGKVHATDAVRHGAHFLLFHHRNSKGE